MSDTPVTYIRDPELVAPVTPVFLVGGSIALNLTPGDITIGAMEIKDADSTRQAHVDPANDPIAPDINVLRVQSIDTNGDVILRDDIQNLDAGVDVLIAGHTQTQATLTALLNTQGTQSTAGLATTANQTTGNSILTAISDLTKSVNDTDIAILNAQGTLATAANQTTGNNTLSSIDSHIISGNSIFTAVLNGQGTQATSANQVAQNQTAGATNAILTAVMNNEGTLATSVDSQATTAAIKEQTYFLQAGSVAPHVFALFNSQVGPGTSPNADVSGFLYHSIQHTISGSLTVETRTSLDGINWNVDAVTQNSAFYTFVGKARYFSCRSKIGSGTVTSLVMSG